MYVYVCVCGCVGVCVYVCVVDPLTRNRRFSSKVVVVLRQLADTVVREIQVRCCDSHADLPGV